MSKAFTHIQYRLAYDIDVPWSESLTMTFVNPYSYSLLRKQEQLLTHFDRVYYDGISLVLLGKLFGQHTERGSFDMTSLASALFDHACRTNEGIYLIGSRHEEVMASRDHIRSMYPDLRIAGIHDGYVKGKEVEVIDAILQSEADHVIVGMGTPLQEEFVIRLRKEGYGGGAYTCGGFLHQTASGVEYYPSWMDKLHMRWVYRIVDEPALLKRYLLDYPVGLARFIIDGVRSSSRKTRS